MFAATLGGIYTADGSTKTLHSLPVSSSDTNYAFSLPLFVINNGIGTNNKNRRQFGSLIALNKKASYRVLPTHASAAHECDGNSINHQGEERKGHESSSGSSGVNGTATISVSGGNGGVAVAKGSGTTARGRRLLKIREEKRKREYDRLHSYPAWAKVLEDACKNDAELRAVLGDSIGNPELMRKRVEERVRQKGKDFHKQKTGSVFAFKVSFRDFNPVDSCIWFELYGSPSDRDVDLIGSVIQAWYVMGRLGAFNTSNLQRNLED
ncbi:uncharacterized protein LOC110817080 isoform X2 [Carica papaya]|uniref:uncharacterized protein LOC110817080 isoform X2 n=1 Tax=Carica papaya TaxID=3649 RepID=UPI000B8C84DF|nr:uncharacterized protein LOC110817080 isoform X2 [Carica papaya]